MPYPGQPKNEPIPPALNRWNWGAFFLNWIWGLGNSTYIALLMFVPFVNIVMVFVLGAKGSQWAWKNRIWADEAHFVKTQRNWARASLVMIIAAVLLFMPMFSMLRNNGSVELAMQEIQANERIISTMGEPIELGWFVTGNINTSGTTGSADLAIPISGPKCSAPPIPVPESPPGCGKSICW